MTVTSHHRFEGLLFVLVWLSVVFAANGQAANVPTATQRIMVGEVTSASAFVQVRLSAEHAEQGTSRGKSGRVVFVLKSVADGEVAGRREQTASEDHDFIARATFADLRPGKRYRCETTLFVDGKQRVGPHATFRTLWGTQPADVRFVVVTGMNFAKFHGDSRIDRKIHKVKNNTDLPKPYQGADKQEGYPALESIRQRSPDFFIGTGDNVYYDTPQSPRAETATEMRQKWHEQFAQPRYQRLFAQTPTYWMMDDHDFRIDDADNSGDYLPQPSLGLRIFLEQLPLGPQRDPKVRTYRTHRVSQDLQLWFPENRLYRSDNKSPDGPKKTIWGAKQTAWLQRTLKESDATFKLLISPTPMVGPDDKRKTDNHTNFGGFRQERDTFFSWLREEKMDRGNFFIVCGDRHWQYHARHPTGIEEFSCGALVDANSRLGRKPGDPLSTDPDGKIEQLYSQEERSGGFLEIRSEQGPTPKLTFVWQDEHGVVLHTHQKNAPRRLR